jgi:hypothetical protein
MWETTQHATNDTVHIGHLVIVVAVNFQYLYHALLPQKENIIELLVGQIRVGLLGSSN